MIKNTGFEAIQVSGYGIVGSYLELLDISLIQFKDVLEITLNIAAAVNILW